MITENAHPSIITEELFNLCQERAKGRNNGGGVIHNPFQIKPNSPFWLRGFFHCDKCGSKMLGHSTSTTRKYGGQRYYLCGGYMRKGKDFCEYVSWRKETIERIVTNKLRTAILRLTLDNQLETEIHKHHNESHRQSLYAISTLETEMNFLKNKIQSMQTDIGSGRAKSFYSELLEEMRSELKDKEEGYEKATSEYQPSKFNEVDIQSIQMELRRLIELLDAEIQNPEILNRIVGKYVPKIQILRETKTVHITFHVKNDDLVLYQKTITVDWDSSL